MKCLIVVLSVVAVSCVSAGHLNGYQQRVAAIHAPLQGYASTGSSSQFRSEDNYGNYQFGYDESHATGSSGRREERSGDVVRGSYNLGDADGRQRTVNYVADAAGFRATVHTNEPGVDSARDPADVLLNKDQVVVAAPAPVPVHVAAPLPIPAPAPAPLLAAPLPAAPVFRAPVVAAKGYAAQAVPFVQAPAPVYAEQTAIIEEQTPRAFSYSFGANHPSFAYAAAAAPALAPTPVAAPVLAAPVYQQHGIKY